MVKIISFSKKISMTYKEGQYFTTDLFLKESVYNLILNDPEIILEPSVGRGDLIEHIIKAELLVSPRTSSEACITPGEARTKTFHMYEIDKKLYSCCLLTDSYKKSIVYTDFLEEELNCRYDTIIGNPPYGKAKSLPGESGTKALPNLYLRFIQKCFALLKDKGELIFIVPSNFTKLTSSKEIINKMLEEGTFTHIIHPNKENLFEKAHIDVIVFRYCKDKSLCGSNTLFNGKETTLVNMDGILTFEERLHRSCFAKESFPCAKQGETRPLGEGVLQQGSSLSTVTLDQHFDIFVGMVTGKDSVFKDPTNQVE